MRCRINSKYICVEQVRIGSGLWKLLKSCEDCEIFLESGQIKLGMVNMTKKEKAKWIEKKLAEAKERRREQREEKGMKELLLLDVGETELEIVGEVEPRIVETKYGDREVIRVIKDRLEYDFMINPKSPLWLEILENVSDNKLKMVIVRSGQGKSTRYSIKKAW